jgi:glycosyltransferase involved in cell wall biosynthesis
MDNESIIMVTGRWSQKNQSIHKTCLKLVNIVNKLDYHVTLFTSRSDMPIGENDLVLIKSTDSSNKVLSYLYCLIYQIRLSMALISTIRSKNVAFILFCFGGDILLLPMICLKILGKSVVTRSDGRPTVLDKCVKKSIMNIFVFGLFENMVYKLSDWILLESESMVSFYRFQKYTPKIKISPLYVDTDLFFATTPITARKYDVGYIGRLSSEKGILELLDAIQLLPPDYKILIIGDGPALDKVIEAKSTLNRNIDYLGLVENTCLPCYYNQIKLFVLPSYKEGLPNSILEAMACGTPVLATPVGGIPWVVKDGVTGYILEDRTPATIAKTIYRVLSDENLGVIINNEIELIKERHSFNNVLANYNEIFREVRYNVGIT